MCFQHYTIHFAFVKSFIFLKVADEFIAGNRLKYTWVTERQNDNPRYRDIINETDPARASQFYYVKDEGVLTATEI